MKNIENPLSVFVTCEHGGNLLPEFILEPAILPLVPLDHKTLAQLSGLFTSKIRNSHRGYDAGALHLARHISTTFGCPLHFQTVSRLFLDMNRSPHNARRFPAELRQEKWKTLRKYLDEKLGEPYRSKVSEILNSIDKPTLHLSVHSFTPILGGKIREVDIGLLYDSKRKNERQFAELLQLRLIAKTGLRVKRNTPYRGSADGLTTYFRKKFSDTRYLGIEIEMNQALLQTEKETGEQQFSNQLALELTLALNETIKLLR